MEDAGNSQECPISAFGVDEACFEKWRFSRFSASAFSCSPPQRCTSKLLSPACAELIRHVGYRARQLAKALGTGSLNLVRRVVARYVVESQTAGAFGAERGPATRTPPVSMPSSIQWHTCRRSDTASPLSSATCEC
eukprot:scaffold312357_cov31-Tisochrysis_lutea.AAC.3